jgi:hypothetical protein
MPDAKGTAAAPSTDPQLKISNRLQVVSIVVSVVALGVAVFAAVSANDAVSKSNQLTASASSASLSLVSLPTARIISGTSTYEVSLNLTNQGGGDAQYVRASIGTMPNIQTVRFGQSCPQPIQTFPFAFPLGTTLGVDDRLAGTAKVPMTVVPPDSTPANSMVLYVSWRDDDGSTVLNCENLSNTSTIGNLQRIFS